MAGAKAAQPKKEWILVSTLPKDIQTDHKIFESDDRNEATYQALASAIVSIIYVSNGVLPSGKHASRDTRLSGRIPQSDCASTED